MTSEKAKHPIIPVNAVKSSNVGAIGYDAATKTLAVQFISGATYHYAGVSPELHAELGKAKSVGAFVASRIVKGGFGATKVS